MKAAILKALLVSAVSAAAQFSSDGIASRYVSESCGTHTIDKAVFKVCYDCDKKAPTAVWYRLDGKLVNAVNIKRRMKFYTEKSLPSGCRSKSSDYRKSGFDRGHMAPDADFDYSEKTLRKTYSMANVVPQYPFTNRKAWLAAERYERLYAAKNGEAYVVNIAYYDEHPPRIGKSGVAVPFGFLKVISSGPEKTDVCLWYDNVKKPRSGESLLKSHVVDCVDYRIRGSK